MSFFNSPAFDLKYFLASSTNLEVRRNSIPELLKIYHETLLKQLELYSYEGPIITFDSLKEEMERIELFGISTSLSILPIVLLENTQSIPDMEELIKDLVKNNSSNVMESWTEFYKPSPMYCEIMKETVSESIKTNPLLN